MPATENNIFLDNWWNRDYAKNACDAYYSTFRVSCFKSPDGIAAEMKLRFGSAVLQAPACKDVTFSFEPVSNNNRRTFEEAWDLSFNVAINGGDIDYRNSVWQIIDSKTNKRFAEGPLTDAVEAATRVCTVVTGKGGSVVK